MSDSSAPTRCRNTVACALRALPDGFARLERVEIHPVAVAQGALVFFYLVCIFAQNLDRTVPPGWGIGRNRQQHAWFAWRRSVWLLCLDFVQDYQRARQGAGIGVVCGSV